MDKPAQVMTAIVDDRLIVEIPADFLINSFEMGITTNICGTVNDAQGMLKYFKSAFDGNDPYKFGQFIDSVCSEAIENGEPFIDLKDVENEV